MHFPTRLQGPRFDLPGALSCVLLCAATLIACAAATAAPTATQDKAKAPISAPSKAPDASNPAPAAATDASPTVTITESATPDTTPDADAAPSRKSQRRHGHIHIGDDDFDSFNDALHTAPWVVGLAFLVAGSILLTPVFLLIGIIWYKLRKTRLQNEALIKLAEKGVMPPAQAVDNLMSDAAPEAAAAAAATSTASASAPVYQQAILARRRAVWSDLRRGVILTAIGLSFVFYSMLESGAANWLGLVLMFLGLGYILLWWFEDRHLQGRDSGVDVGKG